MFSILQAALLGIVQGITEFLPISSSTHLLLFEKTLGLESSPEKSFEIILQLGSGMAIMAFFFKRLFSKTQERNRLLLLLFLATIPVAVVGFFAHHYIKTYFYTPTIINLSLIVGGIAFLLIDRASKTSSRGENISVRQAGGVGIFQTLALIPGVSRSGSTIASGLYVGMKRNVAVEFSFLLAIPALCGAGILECIISYPSITAERGIVLFTGFITAFLSSLFVIRPLIRLVEKRGLTPFGWYRIVLGLLLFTV